MRTSYVLALLGVLVGLAAIVIARALGKRGKRNAVERGRNIADRPRAPEPVNVALGESPIVSGGSSGPRTIATEQARFGDLDWALPLLGRVAESLSSLHAEGVVHGAVTSANVSLESAGGLQITTLSPPRAAENATPADDVFAFGVLAYEMLTGKRPPTPDAVVTFPASVALDPTLRALLDSTLALRAADRPSAKELAWLLAAPTSSSFMTSRR